MWAWLLNLLETLGGTRGVLSLMLVISGAALFCQPVAAARPSRQGIVVFTLGLLTVMLFALEWIANQFSGRGFDKSVVYHLRFGFEGVGIEEFLPMLVGDALVLVLAVALLWWLLNTALTLRTATTTGASRLGSAMVVGALLVNPTLPKVGDALKSTWWPDAVNGASLRNVAGYVPPALPAQTLPTSPNIVWIYAESLERTYFDERVFPGLTPALKKLEQQALSLTNLDQVSAAAWTIAGMVASQCGLPLITGGAHGNSMGGHDRFLPGARCLGDLLADKGYTLHYSAGAALAFAGKGKFYRDHGFAARRGRDEFKTILSASIPMNSWGLHDSTLFAQLREEFSQLIATGRPFGLFSLTLDTHHPKGLPSPVCAGQPYGDGSNPILNAVHCSDRLLTDLIRDLQQRDPSGNTLFVITSDHLAMPNTATTLLQTVARKNLALFIWPGHIRPALDAEAHTTLDTGVTALRLMGYPITALAFGRAVNAGVPSLGSLTDLETRLQDATPSLLTLWDLPDRLDSLAVRPRAHTAVLNGAPKALPLVIGWRADGRIQKLFNPDERSKLNSRSALQLAAEGCAEMKWIERCDKVEKALTLTPARTTDWCVWDWNSDTVTAVATDMTLR